MATIRTVPRAEFEIEKAGHWWRRNRPAVADAFEQELAAAYSFIADSPEVLPVRSRRRGHEFRRYQLRRTGHFIYYRYDALANVVWVAAIWHSRRGREPFRT